MSTEENNTPLDLTDASASSKKSNSIRLFVVGLTILLLTMAFATFWEALGLGIEQTVWLGLSVVVAFVFNITGFIIGFVERKRNPRKALMGIIGNAVLLLFFGLIVVLAFFTDVR